MTRNGAAAGHPAVRTAFAVGVPRLESDRLLFRTPEELLVYDELCRIQRELPRHENLTIAPVQAVRVPGHTWEVDLLVMYRGRVGVIEVDGGAHHGRWAADRTRDRLLEDAGVAYVDRIPVEEARDPAEVRAFLDRFLFRLSRA